MHTRRSVMALGLPGFAALTAEAQPRAQPIRIGVLDIATGAELAPRLAVFKQAYAEYGQVEGRDYVLESRHADNRAERLPDLAAELVRLQVGVILCRAATATRVAQGATTTIPIVMVAAGDPVGSGLVKSLARPAGNATGTSNSLTDIASKHVELLRETLRGLTRLAVLMNPNYQSHRAVLEQLRALAPSVGVQILPAEAGDAGAIPQAIAEMARRNAEALIVVTDPIFLGQRHKIAELLLARRLVSAGYSREFADAGLLLGYGPDLLEFWRRTAYYVDKIVKGASPADLPVEQPTRFDLTINLRTAATLGVTIPQAVLLRANRLIEWCRARIADWMRRRSRCRPPYPIAMRAPEAAPSRTEPQVRRAQAAAELRVLLASAVSHNRATATTTSRGQAT